MTVSRIVGIDPGVTTGFAIMDAADGRLLEVTSCTHAMAVNGVRIMADAGAINFVAFEDARLRHWYGNKGREALQGAGSIKRDCGIWAEWLEMFGVPYKAISPQSKGAKLDAEQFRRLTGWEGRTNEHARDAAMLIWRGRK